MKIAITITTNSGKKLEKEFDNLSEATTYLASDAHKIVRNEAEAQSKKLDEEQLAERNKEEEEAEESK